MQQFEVKLPVKAKDSKEASEIQKALLSIGQQFTASQLTNIASKLRNPLVKAGIIQKLG